MMNFSKNDLSKAQKGDQLWNYFAQIWETVEDIEPEDAFPVKFESGNQCDFSGRETKDDVGPTYFWNEIHFDIPERPKRMVKKEIECWTLVTPLLDSLAGMFESEETASDARGIGYRKELIPAKAKIEIEIEE
jgi:hypothetical protein